MDEMSLTTGGAESGLGFEMLAASLRADETVTRAFLAALATKLEGALPAQTVVERSCDGLFKNTTHVARVDVDLAPFRYTLGTGKRGELGVGERGDRRRADAGAEPRLGQPRDRVLRRGHGRRAAHGRSPDPRAVDHVECE